MANSQATIIEIRIDVSDEQITECYVLVMTDGDSPIGIQGWHHKSFPARLSATDILTREHFGDHLLWPLDAPPDNPNLRNSFPSAFDLAQENNSMRVQLATVPVAALWRLFNDFPYQGTEFKDTFGEIFEWLHSLPEVQP